MHEPSEQDFAAIRSWGLEARPLRAIEDYSKLKEDLRWVNADNRRAYVEYWVRRLEWTEGKTFRKYYSEARKPISRQKWEYLKARKAWYIMPLGWNRFAEPGVSSILDLGCGDGDVTQRIADWIAKRWSEGEHKGHDLEIVGIDLNESRIENARKFVRSPHPAINLRFMVADGAHDGIDYADRAFDHVACTGVIEILDDADAARMLDEICRVAAQGIYIEDLVEYFPGGYPREDLSDLLTQRGFDTLQKEIVLTEPFVLEGSLDPMGLWPILRDMNLFALRSS